MSMRERQRPANEVVFHLLRTLMTGHLVWGAQASVTLSELCTILCTSEASLRHILGVLSDEGLVTGDDLEGTVWLTALGARHLAGDLPRPRVEFQELKWQ